MSGGSDNELLFAYGTLQRPDIQRAELGRELAGDPDSLSGFRLAEIAITDPHEALRNSAPAYPVLVADPATPAPVPGTLYHLNAEELARADAYEGEDYVRRRVMLDSGTEAWAYLAASRQCEEEP